MKVKNNSYQKMKMLERKKNKNQKDKLDRPQFTDKEIDEFRKNNGLPRLAKPVKKKNKAKNCNKIQNNVKIIFKENYDYGETEEIKATFDSVNLKPKSKKDISLEKKLLSKIETNIINKDSTKSEKSQQIEHNIDIVIDSRQTDKCKVEKKVKKKSKKKNKSDKNINDNDIETTFENGNADSKKISTIACPNQHSSIDKLQQRIMQRYTLSQTTDQKEERKLSKKTKKDKETPIKIPTSQDDTDTLKTSLQGVKKDKKKEKLKKLLEKASTDLKRSNGSGNNLRDRMMEKLKAAQFRYLNERLYTTTGEEAQRLFAADPGAFATYHQGYRQQLAKWPVNPLDVIVKKILNMPKSHVIADMGCGGGALSTRVPHTVHSLDLVAASPRVTACDMARTPLLSQSVDVTVYCLSLMGTQINKYLKEANRVLKTGGRLLIAEVESRFDDVNAFARDVERLGFKLKHLDQQHQVFFFMDFEKVRDAPAKMNKLPEITLKPCLYKRR